MNCAIVSCDEPVFSRGWCHTHYDRNRNHGDPEWTPNKRFWYDLNEFYISQSWTEFLAKVKSLADVDENECWNWPKLSVDGYGYLVLTKARQRLKTHRATLSAHMGGIDLGKEVVHHKCTNRACCNPDHLQLVSHRENAAEMFQRSFYLSRIEALESEVTDLKKQVAELRSYLSFDEERVAQWL